MERGGEQGIRIGADGVERDVAEVEQAGEADHDVEPPAEHHVGQDQHAEIQVVALAAQRQRHRGGEQHRGDIAAGAGQPLGQSAVVANLAAAARDVPGQQREPAEEHGEDRDRHRNRLRIERQTVFAGIRPQADKRREQAEGDKPGQEGVA